MPGEPRDDGAIRKRKFPLAKSLDRDVVPENGPDVVERALFVSQGNQFPVAVSFGRRQKNRRLLLVTGPFRSEGSDAAKQTADADANTKIEVFFMAVPFPGALALSGYFRSIFRVGKSRMSGTISSALSSSAKWPLSMR
jgi:hypothetical protein